MNILLVCNNKNLLGNKLVIYSTLFCNDSINWLILLTEEIGEREERNIQNLVDYLDSLSNVVFEKFDIKKSLEEQFNYVSELLYIAPDCMVSQNLERWYAKANNGDATVVLNDSEEKTCVAFIDLNAHRMNEINTYISCDNDGISSFIWGDIYTDYFDPRIGYCGKFSFNFNMPIIFWYADENKKIYETDLKEWCTLYPDFKPYVQQIQLAETIYF